MKSLVIGLAAGIAVYAGLYALDQSHAEFALVVQVTPRIVTETVVSVSPSVAPVLAPKKLVPTGAKTSAKTGATKMAPVLALTPVPFTTISALPAVPISIGKGGVIINEVGWMGTEASPNDEWIELANTTSASVSLVGWKILIAGDNAIALRGAIAPGGYYLLERTRDSTINDVAADFTGSFGRYGLRDTGEHLTLQNSSGATIDDVDCSDGWFAGVTIKGEKASMERVGSSAWQTNTGTTTIGHDVAGQAILGTPRATNSVAL